MEKQRYYFANKDQSNQIYGFFSGHVGMWKLDYKESLKLNIQKTKIMASGPTISW